MVLESVNTISEKYRLLKKKINIVIDSDVPFNYFESILNHECFNIITN